MHSERNIHIWKKLLIYLYSLHGSQKQVDTEVAEVSILGGH